MIKFTDNAFVGGQYYTPGMVAYLDTVTETGLVTSGNAISLPLVGSCLFSQLPLASSVPQGTAYLVTDLGGAAGTTLRASLAGWVPDGGTAILAAQYGTIAAPLATFTGAASGLFTITGGAGSLTIPGGLLKEGRARLKIMSFIHKTNANATADARIYLGPLGTASDPVIQNFTIAITTLNTAWRECTVTFVEGAMLTSQGLGPGAQSATVGLQDKTIDLTVPNILSFGMATANAADSFKLCGYEVTLIMI